MLFKYRYQIGENGFQNAKTVLDRLLEASSPNEKLEIVINFKKEIHSCIINYHVKKGIIIIVPICGICITGDLQTIVLLKLYRKFAATRLKGGAAQ